MYKQAEREYELKGTYLEVKHWYGLLMKRLAVEQTKALGDIDLDVLEKYEKDLRKFDLNILQVDEACELLEEQASKDEAKRDELLAKIPELKERRNYDSLKANREACQADFDNDRKAQRQLALRTDLFGGVWVDIVLDEKFTMDILKNILTGDVNALTFDVLFAMEVLRDFFTSVDKINPLSKSYNGNMKAV